MIQDEIEAVFRREQAPARATLIRLVGDFDLAEDGLQAAFETAVARWPSTGVPDNPRAWLVSVARNRSVDEIRRRARLRSRDALLLAETQIEQSAGEQGAITTTGRTLIISGRTYSLKSHMTTLPGRGW